MNEFRAWLRELVISVFGYGEFIDGVTSQASDSGISMVVAVLIAIWVYSKGRSFLISMVISLWICPVAAFIAQLFLSEKKEKAEERLNRGIAYAIMRFFFGG